MKEAKGLWAGWPMTARQVSKREAQVWRSLPVAPTNPTLSPFPMIHPYPPSPTQNLRFPQPLFT